MYSGAVPSLEQPGVHSRLHLTKREGVYEIKGLQGFIIGKLWEGAYVSKSQISNPSSIYTLELVSRITMYIRQRITNGTQAMWLLYK